MKSIMRIFMVCLLVAGCKGEKDTNFVVVTESGEIGYNVKNAQTQEELSKGLMGMESMPQDEGMIFDLRSFDNVAMWMKDTLIPLDMIFADKDGNIVWVYENAEPMSEELIVPPVNADFVVELNSGQIAKNNIKMGDALKHEFIGNLEK